MTDKIKALEFINQWDFELRQMEQFEDFEGVVETIRAALQPSDKNTMPNDEDRIKQLEDALRTAELRIKILSDGHLMNKSIINELREENEKLKNENI